MSEEDEAEEDKAEEDKAEETKEEDEAQEATKEVAKAISACGGKCAKKNSHAIEPEQSKKPAKTKNNN